MRKIALISTVCALALTGVTVAQDAPAPAPAPTPAPAPAVTVSPEAQKVADEMVAFLKDSMDIINSVTDKASADAAAEKLAALDASNKALEAKAKDLSKEQISAAMQAHAEELMGIIFGGAMKMDALQKADYYGSAALKTIMEKRQEAGSEPQEAPQSPDASTPATMEL